jgi:hypothetical protein
VLVEFEARGFEVSLWSNVNDDVGIPCPRRRRSETCNTSLERHRVITEEEKRGPGQPPHRPTDKQRQTVEVLKANGNPHKVIARVIGIDEKTLIKHYRKELDDGFAQVKAMMGAAVVKAGLRGNIAALRYWLMCRGGPEWRHRDTEDGTVQNNVLILSTTSPEEAARTYARLMSSD